MTFIYHDGVNPPTRITGNPLLKSRDGTEQASLLVITHDSWSPERRAEFDIYEATDAPEPVYDPNTHKLVKNSTPEWDGGTEFTITWSIVPLSAQELSELEGKEDAAALKTDQQVLMLLKARPNQIDNYIENNVTNLESAKEVLKILARAVAVLARNTLR